jgi:hypothetical protein
MHVTATVLLLSVLLSGCASFNGAQPATNDSQGNTEVVTQAAVDVPLEVDPLASDQPTTCDRTHRDLTIDWHTRRYLCVREGRRTAFLKAGGWQLPKRINRPLLATYPTISLQPSHQSQEIQAAVLSPLSGVDPTPLQAPLTVVSANDDPGVLEVPTVPDVEVLEGPTGDKHGAIAKTVFNDTQSVRIWFAPAQEQLGEKGLARSLALLPDIQAAQRVTLLGVFEDEELTGEPGPLDRERFSVARALSVRDLWIEQGVDPAKLTILHHQDRLDGRYVEVMLHD